MKNKNTNNKNKNKNKNQSPLKEHKYQQADMTSYKDCKPLPCINCTDKDSALIVKDTAQHNKKLLFKNSI